LKKNGIQLGKKGIENMLVNIEFKSFKKTDLKIHFHFNGLHIFYFGIIQVTTYGN
jgi:hypothetical protein